MHLEVLGTRQLIVIFLGVVISVLLISFLYKHEKNKGRRKEMKNGLKKPKKNKDN
jgi:hypothetical protein